MQVPADFHFVPGLAWQAALKKTKIKLDLLTDTDIHKDIFFVCLFSIHNTISLSCHEQVCLSGMLWVVEHGRYASDNSKYMKDYGKNKESSYLKYWDE